jgi:AAA+ ATPase superfamily predicted ATPase
MPVNTTFVGRSRELERLSALFGRVGGTGYDAGVAVLMRGRRRIGKSRLVQEFCERSGAPFCFFQASRGVPPVAARAAFAESVTSSSIPRSELFAGVDTTSWGSVLAQLAVILPDDTPTIVVIDEFPWLIEGDSSIEGQLQTAWDRQLSHKPVLLILVGSDLAMMRRINDYDRPFHQRGTVMVVPPLNPAEVADMLSLPAAEAVDAYVVTGGIPIVCQSWPIGQSRDAFLRDAVADPTSALLVTGELILAAEFPPTVRARSILDAIGGGERTWSGIANLVGNAAEPMSTGSLSAAIDVLVDKRVVAVDTPLSTKPSTRDRRYRIDDPYLRFYMAVLTRALPLVERGRADLALRIIDRAWTAWRGRAVEPIIREALLRHAPNFGFEEVEDVGGWWNRQNNPEIDLVGIERVNSAKRVAFAGSIKWLERRPFDDHDYAALARDVWAIPGADETTALIAVSRAGASTDKPAHVLGAEDVIAAWRH